MLRYFLLGTHYRSPLDFSDKSLEEAKNALNGFYDLFKRLEELSQNIVVDAKAQSSDRAMQSRVSGSHGRRF